MARRTSPLFSPSAILMLMLLLPGQATAQRIPAFDPERIFAFGEARDALNALQEAHHFGKIVIQVVA